MNRDAGIEESEIRIREMDYKRQSDARALYALIESNRDYFETYEGIPKRSYLDPLSIAKELGNLDNVKHWGIEVGHSLVGFVSIRRHATRNAATIGYAVDKLYAGKDIATIAIKKVIRLCPKYIRTFYANIDRTNEASLRVIKKVGFERLEPTEESVARNELRFRYVSPSSLSN